MDVSKDYFYSSIHYSFPYFRGLCPFSDKPLSEFISNSTGKIIMGLSRPD